MYRMLVPIDGSESALEGARHAARLAAQRADAQVHLVNVQPRVNRHISQFVARSALDGMREERARAALEKAQAIVLGAGVQSRTLLLVGDPAAEIAAAASRERADQLIIGVTRSPWWFRWLSGALSDRIIARTDVPVTLVSTEGRGGFAPWAVPAAGAGVAALLLAAE